MAHFAKINKDNIVTKVLRIEQDVIDKGHFGNPANWIQTSYNTFAGEHSLGGTPLRKNYAGVGMTYDPIRDAFILPQPYPSWLLNTETCQWHPPVPYPEKEGEYPWPAYSGIDPVYEWDEDNIAWKLSTG